MKYVYLIMSDAGDCKIGRTASDPAKRVKQLQTGASEKLSLVCFFKTSNALLMEKMLHMHYDSKRKQGEWFALADEEVLGFAKQCERFEKTIKALEDNMFIKKRYKNEY